MIKLIRLHHRLCMRSQSLDTSTPKCVCLPPPGICFSSAVYISYNRGRTANSCCLFRDISGIEILMAYLLLHSRLEISHPPLMASKTPALDSVSVEKDSRQGSPKLGSIVKPKTK